MKQVQVQQKKVAALQQREHELLTQLELMKGGTHVSSILSEMRSKQDELLEQYMSKLKKSVAPTLEIMETLNNRDEMTPESSEITTMVSGSEEPYGNTSGIKLERMNNVSSNVEGKLKDVASRVKVSVSENIVKPEIVSSSKTASTSLASRLPLARYVCGLNGESNKKVNNKANVINTNGGNRYVIVVKQAPKVENSDQYTRNVEFDDVSLQNIQTSVETNTCENSGADVSFQNDSLTSNGKNLNNAEEMCEESLVEKDTPKSDENIELPAEIVYLDPSSDFYVAENELQNSMVLSEETVLENTTESTSHKNTLEETDKTESNLQSVLSTKSDGSNSSSSVDTVESPINETISDSMGLKNSVLQNNDSSYVSVEHGYVTRDTNTDNCKPVLNKRADNGVKTVKITVYNDNPNSDSCYQEVVNVEEIMNTENSSEDYTHYNIINEQETLPNRTVKSTVNKRKFELVKVTPSVISRPKRQRKPVSKDF